MTSYYRIIAFFSFLSLFQGDAVWIRLQGDRNRPLEFSFPSSYRNNARPNRVLMRLDHPSSWRDEIGMKRCDALINALHRLDLMKSLSFYRNCVSYIDECFSCLQYYSWDKSQRRKADILVDLIDGSFFEI